MIQLLSTRYKRLVAFMLYLSFYIQVLGTLAVRAAERSNDPWYKYREGLPVTTRGGADLPDDGVFAAKDKGGRKVNRRGIVHGQALNAKRPANLRHPAIGGPNTPEAGSFKSVNADNLVNLFTGDFSYSVPLLDVGGYPVNIFYNGGIGVEQEASWVGLGWNINPGSVNRNMRGIPDDFDGSDTLVQVTNVKPNKTWGGSIGADLELLGKKQPSFNLSIGYSYNNYLGPATDFGAGVSVAIPIIQSVVDNDQAPEDNTQGLNLSLGLNAKLSSRSGLTLSPSLNANLHLINAHTDVGIGLSTSYNSRTGIQNLNIQSQVKNSSYLTSLPKNSEGKDQNDYQAGLTTSISQTTITFARPSYTPTLRLPMQYSNYSGQLEVGLGGGGVRVSGILQGYYSETQVADTVIYKPMVGYLYLQNANGRTDPVMDFNRLNDGPVTPNTPIISAPQYDYDVFSIQGEGTGGSIRAYRNDLGFMRDHLTTSTDKNFSLGFDIAPWGHYGGNVNIVSTPTMSGNWSDGNNTLYQSLLFGANDSSSVGFEHIYFRNPGEATVTNDSLINRIGQDNLVRFLVDGSAVAPILESKLEQFSNTTGQRVAAPLPLANANQPTTPRDKRSQVITMLTAAQASQVGLETSLRSYSNSLDSNNQLVYTSIPRVGGYRKAHHISEVTVLEANGMRYVYGQPVYNTVQQDFTLSVAETPPDDTSNLVQYMADEAGAGSANQNINGNTGIDGYYSMQQTPAYASSFLITGLLSPDYVDRTGDGITEDDLGNAVKFDYAMSTGLHQWRTPRRNDTGNIAHFNVGLKTEIRDNKGAFSYGQREAWYLHDIESKSLIAIFSTSSRNDAKGVMGALNATANSSENVNLKLDSISLYTKADIRANGLPGAVPIKTVHFDYTYALCKRTPDNPTGQGKLTLRDIYFTFNGQSRVSKDMYVFNYGDTSSYYDNANYAPNASDKWGIYKPVLDSMENPVNPNGMNNVDYPYTSTNKAVDDQYAGEWSLKNILLPSGGQIQVSYESDDYAYVQDRRACNMYQIYGFGNNPAYSNFNQLYTIYTNQDQNYVYVKIPTPLLNKNNAGARQEIYDKYLQTLNQLAFKLNIAMPKGLETLTAYSGYTDYGLCPNDTSGTMIYLKLASINGTGSLANASIQFLINNLPGQAFPGYDLSDQTGITAFLDAIGAELGSIFSAFTNAVTQMRAAGKGCAVSLATSFVRLCSPTYFKYGGGHRVKQVVLKDNWDKMTGEYLSTYGQNYCYTTTQDIDGVQTTISSGVASYEPGIGSEENPFREILQFENKLPLASAQYGAIEMPVTEAFYGGPVVGYSQVTVQSINRNGTHGDSIVRSAIGKQVTQYYTAKDFPAYSTYTPMNTIDYHHDPPFSFFSKETIDQRTTSQGFLVVTNDMHGKLKSQTVFSEGDPNTPLSYTIHTYKNTGANGMSDLVQFVHNDQGGAISSGNIGVDMELMTSVREFDEQSHGVDDQANIDFFTFAPFPIFGVFFYPLSSYMQNTYKEVNTTKLINYHAIEDSVIVDDKGSVVSTKTLLYDAQTGSPVVSRTYNEFNDPIFNITYPAYWAYSGMGPAYSNIGMLFDSVSFNNGQIVGGVTSQAVFESGDELYITSPPSGYPGCVPASSPVPVKIWAYDTSKNSTPLTVPAANRSLLFIDSAGQPFTGSGVSLTIVRSGHRNDLGQVAGTVTAMENPIQTVSGQLQLVVNNSDSVVAAAASAFKEKWQVDADIIPTTVMIPAGCGFVEVPSCTGTMPAHVNPYQRGLLGDFKAYRNYVYYGSRVETNPAVDTRIRHNGYIQGFGNYWNFNSYSNLVADSSNTNWLWNTEITRVNSKGQELETHDALNRYTAAQYGFAKNFPVAVTQNAAYGQSFYASFEDNNYNETLNNAASDNCHNATYIDFSSFTIIDTDTTTVKAHTGKYVLRVPANTVDSVVIPIAPPDSLNYTLAFGDSVLTTLDSVGITSSFTPGYPNSEYSGAPAANRSSSPTGVSVNIPTANVNHNIIEQWTGYIQITAQENYNFSVGASSAYTSSLSSAMEFSLEHEVHINGVSNSFSQDTSVVVPQNNAMQYASATYTLALCPGVYKITGYVTDWYDATIVSSGSDAFTWSCTNCSSPLYDSLSSTACNVTTAMKTDSAMLNSAFSMLPGEKMQFSGWVRQDCGTPCYVTNYTNPIVALHFPGADTTSIALHPKGPVIEGWQRVDTMFTVPANATKASLVLGSDSSLNVYFDDLRIHPFNADMKTYVYDPETLRLMAELDENNYATLYNYDQEGQLVRVKKETVQGIKTIKETRTAKQKTITNVQ